MHSRQKKWHCTTLVSELKDGKIRWWHSPSSWGVCDMSRSKARELRRGHPERAVPSGKRNVWRQGTYWGIHWALLQTVRIAFALTLFWFKNCGQLDIPDEFAGFAFSTQFVTYAHRLCQIYDKLCCHCHFAKRGFFKKCSSEAHKKYWTDSQPGS